MSSKTMCCCEYINHSHNDSVNHHTSIHFYSTWKHSFKISELQLNFWKVIVFGFDNNQNTRKQQSICMICNERMGGCVMCAKSTYNIGKMHFITLPLLHLESSYKTMILPAMLDFSLTFADHILNALHLSRRGWSRSWPSQA